MITKEETVKKLKERGYNACLNKGIVTILYKDVDEYENIKDPVRDILRKESGYHSSFAIMCVGNKSKEYEENIS